MKTQFFVRLALAAPLVASCFAGAAQASVIPGGASITTGLLNGNFETTPPTSITGYCYTSHGPQCASALPSWTSSGNTVVIGSNNGDWGTPSSLGGAAAAGLGNAIVGLQSTGSMLSQLIQLTGGGAFTLSWFDAGRSGYGTQAYTVSFDNTLLGTFQTLGGQGWAQHSLNFSAAGPGVLNFSSVNLGSTDRTSFIDNIVLGATVPEPASIALVALGLAGLAGLRRRKAR